MPGSHPLDTVSWPLRTERLVLRRAEARDTDAMWEHRGRADVGEWLGWHPADRADWEASVPSRLPDTLVFELDGRVIGDVMIRVADAWSQREVAAHARGSRAELGWTMHPDVEGRGYATEAVREAIRVCFEELGLHRIEAGAFAANEASQRLMRRVGMRLESRSARDALHRDHGWLDGVMYALLADEWRTRRDGRPSRATILHGYLATPDDHWFPWLAGRLEAAGFEVRVPALPESARPDAAAWHAAAVDAIGDVRDGDAVIAHSLGGLTALRALADLAGQRAAERRMPGTDPGSPRSLAHRLGTLVLVAGFCEPLESLPELDDFIAADAGPAGAVHMPGIRDLVRGTSMVRSDDDAIVPAAASDALAAALEVPVEVVPGAGHFLASEGVTELRAALWPVLSRS